MSRTVTGELFYRYLSRLDPELKLPRSISLINPYHNPEVKKALKLFCNTFYTGNQKRILILGINPGRFGAGITGIPFTDPVALGEYCGIPNSFEKKRELSSTFVYETIRAFGTVPDFYQKFMISAVSPLGFLNGTVNYNYYDSAPLLKAANVFIKDSLKAHAAMNISNKVVISFGEKSAAHLAKYNDELQLYQTILTLKHPRYIMQYKRKSLHAYVDTYIETFNRALQMAG